MLNSIQRNADGMPAMLVFPHNNYIYKQHTVQKIFQFVYQGEQSQHAEFS